MFKLFKKRTVGEVPPPETKRPEFPAKKIQYDGPDNYVCTVPKGERAEKHLCTNLDCWRCGSFRPWNNYEINTRDTQNKLIKHINKTFEKMNKRIEALEAANGNNKVNSTNGKRSRKTSKKVQKKN